ncbi:heterokaryon incompatibility protein-domain-containing protein [Triangularia verruculosa]|uniref:Heterokaryon incompatibility protein-domain-containing protein n=1 Tax=Triangularia verruculosa TaxID=2587418 RepID=A0AAN7AVA4_9PEZI|nr:heterokaryon incompatibility protein-domain-containing protein [Triangularia verruculosa]
MYTYDILYEAMEEAIRQGCTWCGELNRLIKMLRYPPGGRTISVFVGLDDMDNHTWTPRQSQLEVRVVIDGRAVTNLYHIYTTPTDPAAIYFAAREQITNLCTPESFLLARECINNCVNFHTACQKPNPSTLLPDRVIDCSDPENPKLILTHDKQQGIYLTLSYVWGLDQPLKLLTSNLTHLLTHGIPLSQLPQTIRDAITVTHSLNHQYLWIDALCIIQDSHPDKLLQICQMSRIYRTSYLTIIAASASTSREGFLSHPRSPLPPSARVPFFSPRNSKTPGIISLLDTHQSYSPNSTTSGLPIEPIDTRAWTLQEQVLPLRTLTFDSETLKYNCQTEAISIGQALCRPSRVRLPRILAFSTATSNPRTDELSPAEQWEARVAWTEIVASFTLRWLSYEGEKLPAIAGVAEQFSLATGDACYLAGLWKRSLVPDLLWRVGREKELDPKSSRPAKYRAPSWSWASVEWGVYYDNATRMVDVSSYKQVEVVDCWVSLAAREAPFGEVTDGLLRVKAAVVDVVSVRWVDDRFEVTVVDQEGRQTHIGDIYFDDIRPRTGGIAIAILQWDADWNGEGLVLEEVSDGRFRRIGMVDAYQVQWIYNLEAQMIEII